jgi:hypothetical protein
MNPFPLLPNHVVIAADAHIGQHWDLDGVRGLKLGRLLYDLCDIAHHLPWHIGFYNGVDAGASIPGHLHFQFCRRPDDGLVFPLERWNFAPAKSDGAPDWAEGYPIPVARWRGSVDKIVTDALALIQRWVDGNQARLEQISANFVAAADRIDGGVLLYFVPRDRERSTLATHVGTVGGLEVLGEIVLTSDKERRLLDKGEIGYFYVENTLSQVAFFESLAGLR